MPIEPATDTPVDFVKGALVRLRSGGPLMTVTTEKKRIKDAVMCTWFTNDQCNKEWFPVRGLLLVKPPK